MKMNFEQLEKALDNSYIHVYPENERVICRCQGNGIILLSMIDQVLTEITEQNGASYDQALSMLKAIHKNPRRLNDEVINKILGDL